MGFKVKEATLGLLGGWPSVGRWNGLDSNIINILTQNAVYDNG